MAVNLLDSLRFPVVREELTEALILVRDVANAVSNLRVESNVIKWDYYDVQGELQSGSQSILAEASFDDLLGQLMVDQIPDGLIPKSKLTDDLQELIDSIPEDFTNLPVGASSPVKYGPSVIYHDSNRIAGNHLVPLSDVIKQVEANNTLYTTRQSGSFVSAANYNPLTVETVSYGNISAKALVITYNGDLFSDQQLIKFEMIDSTGELTKEYLFPPETIKNGFDYVVSDALATNSVHKKEVRFRIAYDSATNKTKIYIHQRPVSDPPPALYLFIVALYNVESLSQRGEIGPSGGSDSGLEVGAAFPSSPSDKQTFWLEADITNFKAGIYYYDLASTTWKPLFASIGQQFHGRLNVNTIYQSNEIFDFDLTLIRVKPGATFQASVDAPTWSDTTWKALTDPRTGALNTKLELLTFPSALTDATVSGNSVVFKRANELDLVVPIPLPADGTLTEAMFDEDAKEKLNSGGGADFENLEEAASLEDDDEFLVRDFTGSFPEDGATFTPQTLGLNVVGWSVGTGSSVTINPGGKIIPAAPDGFIGILFTSTSVGVYVEHGTNTDLSVLKVGDLTFSLSRTLENQDGGQNFVGEGIRYDYWLSSTGLPLDDIVQNNRETKLTILNSDGSIALGGAPRSAKQRKTTFGDIKNELGVLDSQKRVLAETDATTKTFGATKVPEIVLNNNGHRGRAIATNRAYARFGTSGSGWTLKKKQTNNRQSEPEEFKILYLGYYLANNTTDILIQSDLEKDIVLSINGTNINFATTNSAVTYKGKQTKYHAGAITGAIKTMLDSDEFTLDVSGYDVVETTETDKVEISPRWDIDVISGKENVKTLEDDDELLLNDFSGVDGNIILTAGVVFKPSDLGWSIADGSGNFIKGGSLSKPVNSNIVAIVRIASSLFIGVKEGTLRDIGSIVINGTSIPLTKGVTGIANGWGGFAYDVYSNTNTDFSFVDGESYNIKILNRSGIFISGSNEERLSEQKKVTLGEIKQDILKLVPTEPQTILTPEYLKARPNLARDEIRIDSAGTGTLAIGTDTLVSADVPSTAYQSISIAVKKTDMVDAKFIEVFHAHAPQALAASSGLRKLSQFDDTAKPFSGTFRSDRNYTMEIHQGQNQLGTASSTTDRITFTANTTGGAVYIGEIRIWK